MSRILLSPPDVGAAERELLLEAFDSGSIAALGPHVDDFEREFAAAVDVPHAVALSSGTAALHLALEILGVGRRDEVITSTLTSAATANAICYQGARPVFLDVSSTSWTLDPDLLEEELASRARRNRPAAAVLAVDVYGQCADYDRIERVCLERGVPLVEDAGEALGATCGPRPAGAFGACAAFSFSDSKIVTTGSGGMLVSRRRDIVQRARHLSMHARQAAPHEQHDEVGYSYRLSNLLAAIGRGQLRMLDQKIARRREINGRYRAALGGLPGLAFMPEADYGQSSAWLTCLTVDPREFGVDREVVRQFLESRNIESRPIWKPMHLQPVFQNCEARRGRVAETLFRDGLCLPSGSGLTEKHQERVIAAIRAAQASGGAWGTAAVSHG